ncbi:MAG: NADH-quinone oxidoreductase subunit J [Chloroflexi bacterium]|nr:NADH-quinone oxidoreductase subunit J [Chloroflexota bacterium]
MTADLFLTNAVFFILAAVTLVGGFLAVSARNLVRAALGLIVSFFGVAGIYFVLEAEFVAIVQVLVYVGAISVLILFSIMLTRGLMKDTTSPQNSQWLAAGGIATLVFIALAAVTLTVKWPIAQAALQGDLIAKLGTELVTTYVLPFEAVSLLLLAALIGAFVIARE